MFTITITSRIKPVLPMRALGSVQWTRILVLVMCCVSATQVQSWCWPYEDGAYCDSGYFWIGWPGYASDCACCVGQEPMLVDAGIGPWGDRISQWICRACDAGKHQPALSKGSCGNCPAGKYSGSGSASCQICDPGMYSNEGWSSCAKCAAGKVANSDKSGCSACGEGTYSGGEGWVSCAKCDPGYASVNNANGNSQCTKCGAGKYANQGVNKLGSTLCELCGTNTYALEPGPTDPGNQNCRTCDVVKYTQCAGCSPLEGASKCLTHQEFCILDIKYCGVSSTNPQCHCCSGQFLEVGNGVRKCLSCPVTRYMDENAHTKDACKTCVEGRYPTSMPGADWPSAVVQVGLGLPNHGAIECVGTLAAVSCSGCSVGKYKGNAGSGLCTDCPENSTTLETGSTANACVCNAGYAPMVEQGSGMSQMPLKCSACTSGKFKSTHSRAPTNASDSYIENEKCQDCAVGEYPAHRDEPIDQIIGPL